MADWMSLDYVAVDVEGNGQQPPDLVELPAVPITGGIIREPRTWLVRPSEPIKFYATRIHGLTNKDVADAPVFADIRDEVLAALDGCALVAHNAHVDVGVLQRQLGDWQCPEVFDTLKFARRLLPCQALAALPGQPQARRVGRSVLTVRGIARRPHAASRHL